MEPPRAWIRDTSVIESGRTCAVDPWMRCSNPSRSPITSQPEFTASIVAAEMTELIPGAGPPPHRMPSLGLRSPMGDPRRVRAWRHSLASGGGVSQATPGRARGVRRRDAACREERMPPRRKTVYGDRGGSPMSTYGLTPEVRALRERMRRFIEDEVIPAEPVLARDDEAAAEATRRLKARAKAAGLWALGHPKEIGGGGVPFMPFVYLNEVIGRSHWGQVAVGSLSMQDSIMLHLYGTAEQKRRWLEPLVAGDIYPSVGLTEPEVAGSDPTLMQSTARLEGDHWVVNAHKWFTSGANRAAFTTVFAITEPEAAPHERFSAIIVPTDAVGYEILRIVPTMGHTGGAHCEIQRYVAESAAEIQAARLMTLDAARAMDEGSEARIEIALIKFWGARMLHDVIDRAIQVHGALGVTADTPLEFMYREARYARIYDGPDEVHRMVVARRLLRDPHGAAPWA